MHDFSARFSEDDIICGVFKVELQHSRVDSAVEKISAVMFFTSFLNVMKEEKLTCQHIAKGYMMVVFSCCNLFHGMMNCCILCM